MEPQDFTVAALPNEVETRKDFLDYLYGMMVSGFESKGEVFGETRGRPRLLKTYIMEANQELGKYSGETDLSIDQTPTKVPGVSVLRLKHLGTQKTVRFFVDTSDKRLWLLHTNALADTAKELFEKMVFSSSSAFDKIWLPTEMFQKIADLPNNTFRGFGLFFMDYFDLDRQNERYVDWLRMKFSGSSSLEALDALRSRDKLRSSLAYSMIRLRRGQRDDYAISELGYEGRFTAKGGTSIDAYISLVETTRSVYRATLENIESNSLGVKDVEGRTLVKGDAFDLVLERPIEDMKLFTNILTNSKAPFRIWGLKNQFTKDFYRILAVDLHTGDPIDLEISSNLIRIYLPVGSCGNTVLRLYTNLQHFYDSGIKINDEPIAVGK